MSRRPLILIALLLLTLSASVYAARRIGAWIYAHRPYDCLVLGDVSVQLNTHLERKTPMLLARLDALDGQTSLQAWSVGDVQQLRLVHLPTGAITPLQRMRGGGYLNAYAWRWSPDRRYVFYSWWDDDRRWAAISSSDGTRAATFPIGEGWTDTLDFSADSSYVALLQYSSRPAYKNLIFISVDDFRLTRLPLASRLLTDHDGYRWSPTGHRLVYYDNIQLFVADPESGRLGQLTYRVPAPDGDELFSDRLEWSADGQYILYKYGKFHARADVMTVIRVRGVIPTPVARKVFTSIELRDEVFHWSPTGHALIYFRLRLPNPQEDLPGWQTGDLWWYDPVTGLETRVAWDVLGAAASRYGVILARLTAGGGVVELRDWDGRTQRIGQTFDRSNQQIRQQNSCSVPEHCWLSEIYRLNDTLPDCPIRGFAPEQYEIRQDGRIIWNFQVPPGASVASEPVWRFSVNTLYAAQCRFTARILQQGSRRWVEIGDLFTGTFYPLPETLTSTLPPNFFDYPSPYRWWAFWVIPSPDDQTWMVYFQVSDYQGVVYFFRPDDQQWTLFYQDTDYFDPSIDKVTWSPDSQRMAYTRWIAGRPAPTLFVTTADLSQQWALGYFPRDRVERMAWEKCGGVEAALRGD